MTTTTTTRRALAATLAATIAFLLPVLRAPRADAAWLGKRGVMVFTGHPVGKGKSSVWFMSGDGSGPVEMTPNDRRNDIDASWSPEGGPHVVYTGKPLGGGPGELFVIDRVQPGGGLPKPDPITDDLAGDAEHPVFSPAGGKIAFDLTQPGKSRRIWTSNLVGTKKAPLLCCRTRGYPQDRPVEGRNPAWSPDSKLIAFVAPDPDRPNVAGIWLAQYDQRKPPDFLTDGDLPNWSPLQDKIVYTLGGNLMVANPNPANPDPQAITSEPDGVNDTNPAWTPDSDHVGGWQSNPGTVVFERGGRIFTIGGGPLKGRKSPRAVTSTRFVATNADFQPRCSNDKPTTGTVIKGTNGPDLLCGGPGDDTIDGMGGSDRIFAGNGHDVVRAGPGNDFVLGGIGLEGDDLDGGPGNDYVTGSLGADHITDFGPNSGNDFISGEAGNDDIVAWDNVRANDYVGGGDGTDVCVVDNTDQGHTDGVDFVWSCEVSRLPSSLQRLESQPAPFMG